MMYPADEAPVAAKPLLAACVALGELGRSTRPADLVAYSLFCLREPGAAFLARYPLAAHATCGGLVVDGRLAYAPDSDRLMLAPAQSAALLSILDGEGWLAQARTVVRELPAEPEALAAATVIYVALCQTRERLRSSADRPLPERQFLAGLYGTPGTGLPGVTAEQAAQLAATLHRALNLAWYAP